MRVRRTLITLPIAALLVLPSGASAAYTGGATVPKTPQQVAAGGGASFVRAAPKPPAPKPPVAKRTPAKPPVGGALPGQGRRRVPSGAVGRPPRAGHRFPVAGPYGLGEEGSRFGAPRSGHTHQGQDIAAAEGTPVVAPFPGLVFAVRYQAAGAGHYVVLDGDGEDRDYVFMHLRAGSIPVREGQRVKGGARLGEVGNTGRSFGAHLHFEIWVGGGWFKGGHPIDPLPLLRAWASR